MYKIKDENGKEFTVEEIKEQDEATPATPAEKKPEDVHDDALSAEEISALKELAALAPELKKLIKPEEPAAASEPETHDEAPATPKEKPEKAADTCKDSVPSSNTVNDSACSIEQQSQEINDSAFDSQLEIDDVWAKRLHGGNK